MIDRIKSKSADKLFEYIMTVKTLDECYMLFDDLCTISEIQAISQRMAVAEMLNEKRTYIDIAKATGASTATISRVNRAFNYGSDGYKLVIERLKEEKEKNNI